MNYRPEGASIGQEPMTPDQTVFWDSVRLAREGGTLYQRPDCPEDLAKLVVSLAVQPEASAELPLVGSGEHSTVHQYGAYAIKVFKPGTDIEASGLNTLKANVSLETGFDRINEERRLKSGDSKPPLLHGLGRTRYVYAAPAVEAGFIPDTGTPPGTAAPVPVWAMSYEGGRRPAMRKLPPRTVLEWKQEEALLKAGANPDAITLDDKPENILLQETGTPGVIRLVKFDIQAIAE